jgi:quinoprotein glucose dehydrogenase
LIFLPIGQPAAQYYGGHRAQTNLYSSSVVALDANTGKVRWHFQLTHHDVWDYDNAATPALVDIVQNGRRIPAVVTVAKSGLMFFLHRETGKPVYPVEERPVPRSDIPGEETWPTQPFPVKPPPLSRLGIRPDEIFTGEPEHEKFCRDLVAQIGGSTISGPTRRTAARSTAWSSRASREVPTSAAWPWTPPPTTSSSTRATSAGLAGWTRRRTATRWPIDGSARLAAGR